MNYLIIFKIKYSFKLNKNNVKYLFTRKNNKLYVKI